MLMQNRVAQVVEEHIRALLEDAMEEVETISPADGLVELGLNSLMLARLIIRLEEDLGADPFAEDRHIADIRTVGDLVAAYEAQPTVTEG
jgi:acyl carrier protein